MCPVGCRFWVFPGGVARSPRGRGAGLSPCRRWAFCFIREMRPGPGPLERPTDDGCSPRMPESGSPRCLGRCQVTGTLRYVVGSCVAAASENCQTKMRIIFQSSADPNDTQTCVEKKSARGLPCLCATGLRVAYAWLTRSLRQKPSANALESPHSLRLSYLPRSSKFFLAPGTQRGGEPPRKDTHSVAEKRCFPLTQ